MRELLVLMLIGLVACTIGSIICFVAAFRREDRSSTWYAWCGAALAAPPIFALGWIATLSQEFPGG